MQRSNPPNCHSESKHHVILNLVQDQSAEKDKKRLAASLNVILNLFQDLSADKNKKDSR